MEHSKTHTNIWPRMKAWFRNGSRKRGSDGSLQGTGSDPIMDFADDTVDPAANRHVAGAGLLKRRRNDAVLEKMQEGYGRVIELVDSIQKHQQQQDARAVEISSSLSTMAATLNAIDTTGKDQAEKLASIATELHVGNERSARWENALSEFPRVADAQREALSAVARQMEAVGQRDDQMSQSLESFQEAVTSLGDATTASGVAFSNLQMSTLENQERTTTLMKEQNKRFMMLFVVTLVLAGVAIAAGLIVLWKS